LFTSPGLSSHTFIAVPVASIVEVVVQDVVLDVAQRFPASACTDGRVIASLKVTAAW
jgi:hypothetical protein